ncbi:MAG: PAS-domain containing protein [Gemmobacter sp.]|nr:PAS-domain containing protein [Gemmobacter sp.]
MMLPRRPSVRIRLLSALAFLCLATMLVGAVSWAALDRATSRLETLHRDTLAEVARALTLSQEVSGLATLAPYLLTLDSPFRIRRGGERALASIDRIVADQVGTSIGADLAPLLAAMADGISDLILATETRAQVRDLTLRINAGLAHDERRYAAMGARGDGDLDRRRDWLTLQRLGAALLGAGRAENLIGVGEFQREFHGLSRAMAVDPAVPVAMQAELARLLTLAEGVDGLFDLRRHELAAQIRAESALVGIRLAADDVSALAITVTARAQTDLAAERADTRSTISLAKSLILAVGLGSAAVALGAALYVSGYVTGNLRAISDAMMRLASGDRGSRLPRGEGAGDEIGKLLHAFRAFRANALRLDRSNRQMLQKNALFENMFANIDDGVAILSPAGAVMAANPRLAKVLRVDPETLSGRPDLGAVLTGAGFQVVPGVAGVVALTAPDGAVIERRESALPDGGAVQIYSDVTERRQMDTRLAQIQRIESLGKVTGEVAHDFGNILSTISSSLHLLETAPPERAPALRQSIGSAVDLGAALTQRLLACARRLHLDP